MSETTSSSTRQPIGAARSAKRAERVHLAEQARAKPVFVFLFVLCLVLPPFFEIAGLRMSFLRLILLTMFIPTIFRWMTGAYGGLRAPDLLIIAYAGWVTLSGFYNHGLSQIQFFAITNIELLGAYFLARVYIRDVKSFVYFVRLLCITLLILIPFALYESLTVRMLISDLFAKIPGFQVEPSVNVSGEGAYEKRLGLYRAQVTFPHPILYGVFASSVFALAWFVPIARGANAGARSFWAFVVFVATFFSLSSGGILAIMVQLGLIGWNVITKAMGMITGRWRLLFIIFAVFYVVIDLLSDRTPITIFISFATFSSGTAWYRILIWEYGSAVALNYPLFGIGNEENWQPRPHWMSSTVDNFWLLTAMRSGIPGFVLLASAVGTIMWKVGSMDFSKSAGLAACQKGYLMSFTAMVMSLCTVHIWSSAFVYVVFLLGAGVWMYTNPEINETHMDTPPEDPEPTRAGSRMTPRSTLQRKSQSSVGKRPTFSRPPKGDRRRHD